MNYFRIGQDFEGHLEQLYHFVDKEILSSEIFSLLSKDTEKSVAELKWQFNLSGSKYVFLFTHIMVAVVSNSKLECIFGSLICLKWK